MDDFRYKLISVNVEEIKVFLLSLKKPCYESEMLKIAFKDINILNIDSLALYQNHFILFHILHLLKAEFEKKNKYLHIHFMRTFLLDYPEEKKCRFYNDKLFNFCNAECNKNKFYCDFHFDKIKDNQIDSISEKYFYLDESNYSKLNKDTIEPFLNGTWEILKNYDDYKNSFKILDLPESADLDTIKKRFKYLAKEFHPDKGNAVEDKFKEINNAYQLLMKIIPNKKIF
jgi:hypothetical protein